MTTFTHEGVTLTHGDCMDFMAGLKDGAYSLAVCDPPYGIGVNTATLGKRKHEASKYQRKNWDTSPPTGEFFSHLFRTCRNQIIWGANNFQINNPCSGWAVWDKGITGDVDFSTHELAYTSFPGAIKCFRYRAQNTSPFSRIHPTQKPIALYRWLLQNYARPGDTILDTHLGSGSSAIAAWEMGYTFTGIEIDADYYAAAVERFKKRISQPYIPGIVLPAKAEQNKLL